MLSVGAGGGSIMKHRVTVQKETRKHFLGIPYTTGRKEHIIVDGKTYRKMKQTERERSAESCPSEDELAACAALVWEEEMVDIFGE